MRAAQIALDCPYASIAQIGQQGGNVQSAAFIKLMSENLTQPEGSVRVYARLLKEAGLISTGARGRNAPDMTPLDAARLLLALLVTDSPAQCVERTRRFGPIPYSPDWQSGLTWQTAMDESDFRLTFHGDTLEEVLAFIIGLPASRGMDSACLWHHLNPFHLRVHDFQVRAELFRWETDPQSNGQLFGSEIIVPFQGDRMQQVGGDWQPVGGFSIIKGGIQTTRSVSGTSLLGIGIGLAFGEVG